MDEREKKSKNKREKRTESTVGRYVLVLPFGACSKHVVPRTRVEPIWKRLRWGQETVSMLDLSLDLLVCSAGHDTEGNRPSDLPWPIVVAEQGGFVQVRFPVSPQPFLFGVRHGDEVALKYTRPPSVQLLLRWTTVGEEGRQRGAQS